jgi:dolichol-phosphate mannosyltransferase
LGALSDYPIPLNAGIFSLMDRKAVDAILALREKNRYLPGLRAWIGYRNAIVYYDRQDRARGDGKLSFVSRIKYAMDAITSFSYKPLRLSFGMFVFTAAMAFFCILCMLISGSRFASAAFGVASAVFFVGGLLLLSLGILGEYVGRVYDEVRCRPVSLVAKLHRAQAPLEIGINPLEIPATAYNITTGSLARETHFRGRDAA